MKFIDLFCGCGMFSEGMKQAGHKPILGIDNWKTACESYQSNHTESLKVNMNILDIDPSSLPKTDLIIGSPPCQKFSLANTKSRTEDDTLIKKYIEIVEVLKPKYWIMEEVPRAINFVPKTWIRKILSASNYGAIHQRKRLFAGNYILPFPKFQGIKKAPTPTTAWNRLPKHDNSKFRNAKEARDFIGTNELVECLKKSKELMGVPNDYILIGNLRDQIKQVGNGVYIPLIKKLGLALKGKELKE